MDAPVFQREHYRDVWDELVLLAERHYRETTTDPDQPLSLRRIRYEALDEAGALRLYTARVGGAMVGYDSLVVGQNHAGLIANSDGLYVEKAYRGDLSIALMRFTERDLLATGVIRILRTTKAPGVSQAVDHGRLLERLGYSMTEVTYSKRLAQPVLEFA